MKYLAAIGMLSLFYMFTDAAMAQTDTIHTPRRATYTVEQGDTLYTIAQKFDPKDNPNAVAYEIEKENGIGSSIHPGQTIIVPIGG
jgi:LysM repeat protein